MYFSLSSNHISSLSLFPFSVTSRRDLLPRTRCRRHPQPPLPIYLILISSSERSSSPFLGPRTQPLHHHCHPPQPPLPTPSLTTINVVVSPVSSLRHHHHPRPPYHPHISLPPPSSAVSSHI